LRNASGRQVLLDKGLNIGEELILAEDNAVLGDVLLKAAIGGGHDAAERAGVTLEAGQVAALHAGLRNRVHFIRIRIWPFRLNTDPIRAVRAAPVQYIFVN
jgi:hypothetical protein